MGLDLTLTDDFQPATVITSLGEGLPAPAVAESSNSKTANAIADILGLSTNPYLTSKDDKNNQLPSAGDFESAFFDTTFASTTDSSPPTNTLSLSQPMDSLLVSKEELQSIMPSQETLDALRVSPSTSQSLAQSDSSKPTTQPVAALNRAASELLNSLPDVTFMLSNSLTLRHANNNELNSFNKR